MSKNFYPILSPPVRVRFTKKRLSTHLSIWAIFLPELVVIGGGLSMVGDYFLLPLRAGIRKYSLNLVNKDTVVCISKLGDGV